MNIERLKKLMDEKEMTQVQLEAISGISRRHIIRIMKGETKNITMNTLEKIAHALDTHPSILV